MKSKYTCIVVDDEPLARRLLANYLDKTLQLELKGTFKSAQEVITYLKKETVDLLFLDIQMPGLSGIGLLETKEDLPPVILTTAYETYAVKAFELDVVDYLVKPFPIERYRQAVNRFEEYMELRRTADGDRRLLTVKSNYGLLRIPHHQIQYVSSQGEYMKIVLEDRLPELIYMRMKDLEGLLGDSFIRIHKSSIVNKSKIEKIEGNHVTIGNMQLKISRKYKPTVLKSLSLS